MKNKKKEKHKKLHKYQAGGCLVVCQVNCSCRLLKYSNAGLVAQMVKNLPAVKETWVRSLGQEDPLEKGMAAHCSILAWRIHEQRSLASYSSLAHKNLDVTEQPKRTHTGLRKTVN